MSDTFECIKRLVTDRAVRISDHGYDELVADDISTRDVIERVGDGRVVEDHPDYPKGRCVLVLQSDRNGNPVHVLWGIRRDTQNRRLLSPLTDQIQPNGRTDS